MSNDNSLSSYKVIKFIKKDKFTVGIIRHFIVVLTIHLTTFVGYKRLTGLNQSAKIKYQKQT